jgi:importin subunit beta-1
MESEFKGNIKTAILATLASPKSLIRGQIASILAQIGKIEVPRKEWDELIPSMCTNSKSEDINIRLASLKTLGYICEELQTNDLDDTTKNLIILALLQNLMTEEVANGVLEPSRLAIAAFVDSIPFTAPNFQKEEERNFIMEKIFNACGSADESIQENSLHCLREIAV